MIYDFLRYAVFRWVRRTLPVQTSLHFFNHSALSQSKRMRVLRRGLKGISRRATIAAPLTIECADFEIGRNSFINAGCIILNGAMVQIGDGTLIGPAVKICATYHHADPIERAQDRSALSKPITIGNNVWIGAGATICAGVTIEDDVVVAAGAVVTRDVPRRALVAGVPAMIKKRWPSARELGDHHADDTVRFRQSA